MTRLVERVADDTNSREWPTTQSTRSVVWVANNVIRRKWPMTWSVERVANNVIRRVWIWKKRHFSCWILLWGNHQDHHYRKRMSRSPRMLDKTKLKTMIHFWEEYIILKFGKHLFVLFVCLSAFFSKTSKWIATKLGRNNHTGLGRVMTDFWYHL